MSSSWRCVTEESETCPLCGGGRASREAVSFRGSLGDRHTRPARRTLALCLAVLLPVGASAQTVASSLQAAQPFAPDALVEDRLDVLPAVAVDEITIVAGAIRLAAAACIIVTQVTKEEEEGEENPTLSQTLIAAALTSEQRQSLATEARSSGRGGVVLQRVVEARAGVGDVPGAYALEVVVVDAETGQLWPIAEDLLGASSVLSVPIGEDLNAATAEALQRIGA